MTFEIYGQPQGKHRPRFTTVSGHARAVKVDADVIYENLIIIGFKSKVPSDYNLYEKGVNVRIEAYYDIPKTFSKVKRKRALEGKIRPLVKPDVDNIAKVVCDALNGVAYKDDTQIAELTVRKYYAEQPKVVVAIEEA